MEIKIIALRAPVLFQAGWPEKGLFTVGALVREHFHVDALLMNCQVALAAEYLTTSILPAGDLLKLVLYQPPNQYQLLQKLRICNFPPVLAPCVLLLSVNSEESCVTGNFSAPKLSQFLMRPLYMDVQVTLTAEGLFTCGADMGRFFTDNFFFLILA